MKKIATITMALLIAFWNTPANADWIDPGISYKCNISEKVFALEAVMKTSAPEDKGTILITPGFTMLTQPDQSISCTVGITPVTVNISRTPGSSKGMCAAFGFIHLNSLKIDGNEILKHRELFNSGCFSEPVLFRAETRDINGKIIVKLCKGKWDWGIGYHEIECSEINR